MRVLIYSDVHANLEALQAMAAYAAGRSDASLCLGDLVGYGADPNPVVAWARAHTRLTIRGNHDRACAELHGLEWFNPNAAAAARWTHQALEPELRTWLSQLPEGPAEWRGLRLVHGSPRDEDEYIVAPGQAGEVFAATAARLHFFGHTHVQGGFVQPARGEAIQPLPVPAPGDRPAAEELMIALQPAARYLVNPGSVGQPRDGDPRAAFALYDTERDALTFCRVPYPVAAARDKILAAGLSPALAHRLARGR